MRKEWDRKTLGEVCIVERGSSPRPIDNYITDSDDGVNWIKIGDTKGVTKYLYSTRQKITKEGARQSRFVKEDDIILSNSMSFGNPFIMKTQGYIHDGWFVLRLPEYLDSEYFYYLITSPNVQKQIQSLASGAIVKNISGDLVRKVNLSFPKNISEQKRIVEILDETFAAINKAKVNVEKNLQNAKELFEGYLQNVFANKGKDWEEKRLGDVCSLITDGKHGDCENAKDSGYYFLSAKDVRNGTLIFDGARQIKKVGFEETHRRTNLKPGDICMVNTGATIGRMSIAPDDIRTYKSTFQKSVAVIKTIPSLINNFYCCYLLKSDLKKLVKVSSGTAVPNLLLGDLKKHLINLPKSLKEQQYIVAKLDELYEETNKLEIIYKEKLNSLEELKKSILQKAFNGELTMASIV
ncbi:MAG TPA: restriction endonuclease subunit S [Panacibacter sp.]|nr:restriction endonuclease subunit S [Panacibacter sp.]